ncbi:chaperone modulator CbpM [Actinoplanes subtropicus]|uniref:chaperone modulator CbpM n=1 Tax=Actinoplanes subtropicus TaxID=543632 RepID=UPI0004C34D6E|nr:chaperone modulator CbpM [Actinoplanes subtropicus]
MTRYVLARRAPVPALTLPQFAAAAGLDPHMVARLVRLGLLDTVRGPAGMLLPAAQLARAARIVRLRAGLGLNYAAVGVVLDLLDRIRELEAALRTDAVAARAGHRR